ncbi:hypothetical protein ETB97_005550 [Aspergillus alliaceus]|uniref:Uncharacterized protein n=1 Tax=Petromyces alliaceus TaxID=209559 RepID=A0A8H5ZYJ3_PETAA|nr:hypothetical protein ETB97_005550 [Aspergillus burnettii]
MAKAGAEANHPTLERKEALAAPEWRGTWIYKFHDNPNDHSNSKTLSWASTRTMSSKVANKNILLLGGTAGISLTVAKEALQSGANISVASSSEDRVQKALKTLSATTPDASSKIRTYTADLSIKKSWEKQSRTS